MGILKEQAKLIVDWKRFHIDSYMLAGQIKASGRKFDKIVAITRGGMVPAAILATELNIKYVDTLCVSSYDGFDHDKLECIKAEQQLSTGAASTTIVVDDLVDSGQTFKYAQQYMNAALYAAVYAKPKGITSTDIYVTRVPQDTWIVFPWESQPLS